jgi:hypothetical protein
MTLHCIDLALLTSLIATFVAAFVWFASVLPDSWEANHGTLQQLDPRAVSQLTLPRSFAAVNAGGHTIIVGLGLIVGRSTRLQFSSRLPKTGKLGVAAAVAAFYLVSSLFLGVSYEKGTPGAIAYTVGSIRDWAAYGPAFFDGQNHLRFALLGAASMTSWFAVPIVMEQFRVARTLTRTPALHVVLSLTKLALIVFHLGCTDDGLLGDFSFGCLLTRGGVRWSYAASFGIVGLATLGGHLITENALQVYDSLTPGGRAHRRPGRATLALTAAAIAVWLAVARLPPLEPAVSCAAKPFTGFRQFYADAYVPSHADMVDRLVHLAIFVAILVFMTRDARRFVPWALPLAVAASLSRVTMGLPMPWVELTLTTAFTFVLAHRYGVLKVFAPMYIAWLNIDGLSHQFIAGNGAFAWNAGKHYYSWALWAQAQLVAGMALRGTAEGLRAIATAADAAAGLGSPVPQQAAGARPGSR